VTGRPTARRASRVPPRLRSLTRGGGPAEAATPERAERE
jgi:hypothetical protein